jgi:hypothetical protein
MKTATIGTVTGMTGVGMAGVIESIGTTAMAITTSRVSSSFPAGRPRGRLFFREPETD